MTLDLMLELAWKSGLIAGAALAGASLLRARPAAERVAVLRLGVVMLLALPLLVALLPALRVQTSAFLGPTGRTVAAVAAPPAAPAAAMEAAAPRIEAASPPPLAASPEWRLDPLAAAAVLWAAGFGFLVLRLLAGVTLLHRWTRRAEPVSDPRWLAALARTAQGRTPPVLRASPRVTSPLSWGWRPAIILLDPAALDLAARADAVLAHEMGHVRHGDWLFLMASRLLVALFWFNPLVWILQRELARQSEQAADAWAAGRIGRADYATALVAMAARGRPHAALGMAAPRGELARRVMAIMTASAGGGKPWRAALTLTTCLGFATPLAAIELSPAVMASALPSRLQPAAVRPVAESPVIVAVAIAAAMTPTPARPGDAPPPPAELATVLRQRDQGLAMMEAGARTMEAQAREMRIIAAGLDPDDRAALNADADALLRDAAGLRAEARELAARDPATLRPLSPGDERDLLGGMDDGSVEGGPADRDGNTNRNRDEVRIEASGAFLTSDVRRDASGAVRTASGLEIDASGAVRTSSGFQINASGNLRTDVDVSTPLDLRMTVPRSEAVHMREGARQMREGAAEMDVGAAEMERSIAADPSSPHAREGPARILDMRRQAAEMRRQADQIDARANQAEAPA